MRNYIQHSVKVMIAVVLIALGSACKKSDSPEPPKPENGKITIENAALVTALKEQGFTFEGNTLVVNDKVRTTTSLNLSGKQLTDVKGLDAFPALSEVNLSNNKFAQTFDFGTLPATVKSVNLSGNELYDFKNLATTDYSDNAQEPYKLIRSFDKLVLPATAKYNMDVLPAYVKLAPKSDVQILNAQGTTEKYTTLREVPDPVLLQYLKANFASVFSGDKIDISKSIKVDERANAVKILKGEEGYNEPEFANLKNLEGIIFITNNPLFRGDVEIRTLPDENFVVDNLKISPKTGSVVLYGVSTPNLNLTRAEDLFAFWAVHNKGITNVNLSASKKIMQRGETSHLGFVGDFIIIADCPNLKTFTLPDVSKSTVSPISIFAISLLELPKLTSTIDLSKIQVFSSLQLAKIPATTKIIYPADIKYFTIGGNKEKEGQFGKLILTITKDIYDKEETKAFIQKYLPNNRITTSYNFVDNLLEDSEIYDYTDTNNESGRPSIHNRSFLNKTNNKALTLNEIVKLRFGNSKHKK